MAEAIVPGTVIICHKDPMRSKADDMIQYETTMMYANLTDPTKLPVIPYFLRKKRFLAKDYLAVDVVTTAVGDIDTPESDVQIPITCKNVRTGVKYPAFLVLTGGGAYNMTMTDPTATEANVRKEWLYWQVPDGLEVCLGHEIAFNSRLLLVAVNDGV